MLVKTLLLAFTLAPIAASAQTPATRPMWVNAPTLNLRGSPSAKAATLIRVPAGREVAMFEQPVEKKYNTPAVRAKWAQVSYSWGEQLAFVGWVARDYLVVSPDSVKAQAPAN